MARQNKSSREREKELLQQSYSLHHPLIPESIDG
jgi:hypothetical protein